MFNFDFFKKCQANFQYSENSDGSTLVYLGTELSDREYDSIKYVVESCGGHWREQEKGFIFPMQLENAKNRINHITKVQVEERLKKARFQIDNQFYQTPKWLANEMIQKAHLHSGDRVLEPSAGRGIIAKAVLDAADVNIVIVEPNSENFKILDQLFAHYTKCEMRNCTFEQYMEHASAESFDAIIMNPPFAGGLDIKHIMMAYNLLKPQGILLSVAGRNSLYYKRPITEKFVDFLETVDAIIEDVPFGAFQESGTLVDTCVIKIARN